MEETYNISMSYQINENCTGCGFCIQWCPVKAIYVRKKQKHKILSYICIECGACGRICGFHAVLDSAGNFQLRLRLAELPKPRWDYGSCDGCGICEKACPTGSIYLNKPLVDSNSVREGAIYTCNAATCISCGFCQRECPKEAIYLINQRRNFA